MSKAITAQSLVHFADQAAAVNFTTAQRAVTANGIYSASENNFLSATNSTVFSHELTTGLVTDQKKSGRCWLFATLNTLRHQIEVDYNMETFELSQSHLYFWDKLEKSNTFYERMIEWAQHPLDDRHVERALSWPQGDGGWWEYSAALINKYGIVPKHVMPESVTTSDSFQLNELLNRILRKGALSLRRLISEGRSTTEVQAAKQVLLGDVYRFLSVAIGTPPESFDFSYRDKDKKFHRQGPITPLDFLKKYTRNNLAEYVSVLNDPSSTKQYGQTYRFDHGGNVIDGVEPLFLNVEMETLKNLTVKQLEANESVWFGCDVTKDTNKKGFMALDVYDFQGTFGVDLSLSKAERLASRDSSVTHAMTITGVDLIKDKPTQWKVENSWGENRGLKGFYTMSNDWFNEYGYVVVIRRDLLDDTLKEVLEKPSKLIPQWDPLNVSMPN